MSRSVRTPLACLADLPNGTPEACVPNGEMR